MTVGAATGTAKVDTRDVPTLSYVDAPRFDCNLIYGQQYDADSVSAGSETCGASSIGVVRRTSVGVEKAVAAIKPRTVKVIRAGNVIEVMASRNNLRGGRRKLDDEIEDAIDAADAPEEGRERDGGGGRIGETSAKGDVEDAIRHHRAENPKSLQATFRRIGRLMNANATNPALTKWITLTYAPVEAVQEDGTVVKEPMTDTSRLYSDMDNFHHKMRRWAKGQGLTYEYIDVVEPQGWGAWHVHELAIFGGKPPFISNDDMGRMWPHGYFSVKTPTSCDNFGAYLSAYLGNAEYHDGDDVPVGSEVVEKTVLLKSGKRVRKKFIKGARLHYYPKGMRIYRASRGVSKPEVEYIDAEGLAALMGELGDPHLATAIRLSDGAELDNTLVYFQWNKKRPRKLPTLEWGWQRDRRERDEVAREYGHVASESSELPIVMAALEEAAHAMRAGTAGLATVEWVREVMSGGGREEERDRVPGGFADTGVPWYADAYRRRYDGPSYGDGVTVLMGADGTVMRFRRDTGEVVDGGAPVGFGPDI